MRPLPVAVPGSWGDKKWTGLPLGFRTGPYFPGDLQEIGLQLDEGDRNLAWGTAYTAGPCKLLLLTTAPTSTAAPDPEHLALVAVVLKRSGLPFDHLGALAAALGDAVTPSQSPGLPTVKLTGRERVLMVRLWKGRSLTPFVELRRSAHGADDIALRGLESCGRPAARDLLRHLYLLRAVVAGPPTLDDTPERRAWRATARALRRERDRTGAPWRVVFSRVAPGLPRATLFRWLDRADLSDTARSTRRSSDSETK